MRARGNRVVIGTDKSLSVCRMEGYPIISYRHDRLFPPRLLGAMDKYHEVTLMLPNPEGWSNIGRRKPGKPAYRNVRLVSWNDAWEVYTRNKEAIDRFISGSFDEEPHTSHDLLMLLHTLTAYLGDHF